MINDADRINRIHYCFFFQAEDGIRDLVRSRGLGDVYKRQVPTQDEIIPNYNSSEVFQHKVIDTNQLKVK